jgi:hypothetical protein
MEKVMTFNPNNFLGGTMSREDEPGGQGCDTAVDPHWAAKRAEEKIASAGQPIRHYSGELSGLAYGPIGTKATNRLCPSIHELGNRLRNCLEDQKNINQALGFLDSGGLERPLTGAEIVSGLQALRALGYTI